MNRRVILVLASLLFFGGLGVCLAACSDSKDEVPPMPGTPDDPNYMKGSKAKEPG